ncbi:MAG: right-handed parallel beta-helix repeat-containing protein [Nanoarchaeota archaeon]|nr:right-handed parallel beta-helix repeat-containing protein [Nanoarchaeota archaeon]
MRLILFRYRYLILIIILFYYLNQVFSYTNISTCGVYPSGDYRINTTIIQNQTPCLYFGEDDVDINCQDNFIYGNGTGVGIDFYYVSNISIYNCNIGNFSTGVRARNTQYSKFYNLVISNNSGSGFFYESRNNQLNNITLTSNSINGIYLLFQGQNTTINNLTVKNSQKGIFQNQATGVNYSNILAQNNSIVGLDLANGASNSIVNTYTSVNNLRAISLSSGSNNNFLSNMEIIVGNLNGIRLSSSSNNIFTNTIIQDSTSSGILFYSDSNNNTFYDNVIINNSADLVFDLPGGIGAQNNTFYNNILGNVSNYNIDPSFNFSNNYFTFLGQGNEYVDNSSFINNCIIFSQTIFCDDFQKLYVAPTNTLGTSSTFPSHGFLSILIIFISILFYFS